MEKLFVSLMMLTSSVFYACIFGQVTTLVDSLDQIQGRYQHQLQRFIERLDLTSSPPRSALGCTRTSTTAGSSRAAFRSSLCSTSLPSGIRRDIQMSLLSSIVADLSIFASTPSNFVAAVVERFRTELIVGNEYVFTADEPGQCLYIIHTGRVDVITPEGVHVGRLGDGSYFGEIAILVGVRRTSSVRTACRCHFYKLSKDDFDEVLEGYPEMRERMVTKAMTRLRTILKVRTTSVSDAWAGRASRNAVEGVDESESIDGAEPAAERPAEALALNRWGEEKGDDVEMRRCRRRPAMSPTCCRPPPMARRRRRRTCCRPRAAATSPSRSPRCARSFVPRSAASSPPGSPWAGGGAAILTARAPWRSPPPSRAQRRRPPGERRSLAAASAARGAGGPRDGGGDRNSHRRKSISVLSHPAAAGIIE